MQASDPGDFARVFTHEEIERAVKRGRQLRSEAICAALIQAGARVRVAVSRLAARIRHGLLAGKFPGSVRRTEDPHPSGSGALRCGAP